MAAFPCQTRHGMVIPVPPDPYVVLPTVRADVRSPSFITLGLVWSEEGGKVAPAVVLQAKRTWRSRFALNLPYRERVPANYPLRQTN